MIAKRKKAAFVLDDNRAAALRAWSRAHLNHEFSTIALLDQALTHRSLTGPDYQRLEFLGDRVLGCVIAAWIYERYPSEPEGKLSKRFSELVRKETCATVARAIEAGGLVRLEQNAAASKLHQSDNLLGDVCESIIGALFLDGGMDVADDFIRSQWHDMIEGAFSPVPLDAKSALQEWAQARDLPLPIYKLSARSGPDHAPHFQISVTVNGFEPVVGDGASKADAEKNAATHLLSVIQNDNS
jgi:ribonuclease III